MTASDAVPPVDPPWAWLASTYALQRDYFGVDLSAEPAPERLADDLVMQSLALIAEVTEFLGEVGWKDWARPRGWVNRDAAVGELVDVAHFLANLLVHLRVTDDEWQTLYQRKQEINRRRQRAGYDGVGGKCVRCGRALDDPAVGCYRDLQLGRHHCQEDSSD